jgi:hyperosmotically inducible protein
MRVLFLSSLILLTGEAALAQAPFAGLDRNEDGVISRSEASADREIRKRFAAFDRDGNGRLSRPEHRAAVRDIDRRVALDAAITARVRQALLAEQGIPSGLIAVDTYEGRVHLRGHVGAADLASRAGRVTATVDGVRMVRNDIAVK